MIFKIFGPCRGFGGDRPPETFVFGGSDPLVILEAEIDENLHYPLGVFFIDFPVRKFVVSNLKVFEISTLKSSTFAGDFAKISSSMRARFADR